MNSSFADEIIAGHAPSIESYLKENNLEDLDEYGFTPLVECAIVSNNAFAARLIKAGAKTDTQDITGRTALHWAVDNNNLDLIKLLLAHKANPNAYSKGGQPVLVYPLLRNQWDIKDLLYRHGANLHFAQDFINAKLIGHRFSLKGDVDILTGNKEYIVLDFEGFYLEFTLAMIYDSLNRFRHHFLARQYRTYFTGVDLILEALEDAQQLLKFQGHGVDRSAHELKINKILNKALVILPVAYRGHAITFLKAGRLLAKVDRGENSQREGCINIYYIHNYPACDAALLKALIYKKQTKKFVHHHLNQHLQLEPLVQFPVTPQLSGNCSWANVEATVPAAYLILMLSKDLNIPAEAVKTDVESVEKIYHAWQAWDQDRALYDCMQGFYSLENPARKASRVSMLAAILFQRCDYQIPEHLERAERILQILMLPEYRYVLDSYVETYITKRLTQRGNNLLQILEDQGIHLKTGRHAMPIPKERS